LKAKGHALPHWQPGFFDHLTRHRESYAAKWRYVQQNPVRARLVKSAEDWLYQGEIARIAELQRPLSERLFGCDIRESVLRTDATPMS